MRVLRGQTLAPGEAAGRVFIYRPRPVAGPGPAAPLPPEERVREITRFREVLTSLLRFLAAREAEWAGRGGGEARYAFVAYQAALEDQSLWSGVAGEIDRTGCAAAAAVLAAADRLAAVLAGVRDPLHEERRRHLEEAAGWLWRRLQGRPGPVLAELSAGAIVVADDLPPVELLLADPLRVAGVAVATAESRLTGLPNPAGIPLLAGVAGLPGAVREGQRALLRAGDEAVALCLDPPVAAWQAVAAAADGRRRRAAMARTADGLALPLWTQSRSRRGAQQGLAAGAEHVLLRLPRQGQTPPPPGCWLAAPVEGDLAAPLRLAQALGGKAGPAPVAAVLDRLDDLAAAPALLARCRRARRPLAALVVDLGRLAEPAHPGVLRLLQAAAAACTRERVPLALGGGPAALRLLPLWLGAGASAWWGELADGAVLREQAARLRASACREAFTEMLAESGPAGVEAAVERLFAANGSSMAAGGPGWAAEPVVAL